MSEGAVGYIQAAPARVEDHAASVRVVVPEAAIGHGEATLVEECAALPRLVGAEGAAADGQGAFVEDAATSLAVAVGNRQVCQIERTTRGHMKRTDGVVA